MPKHRCVLNAVIIVFTVSVACQNQATGEDPKKPSSYMPVVINEAFPAVKRRMEDDKAKILERQKNLLEQRYDLSNRPGKAKTMFRGKPIQEGIRARLADGTTWDKLATMSSKEMREKHLFPIDF